MEGVSYIFIFKKLTESTEIHADIAPNPVLSKLKGSTFSGFFKKTNIQYFLFLTISKKLGMLLIHIPPS